MLVTIAISGSSERNARSYSSASITMRSPRPAYAFVPRSRRTAPQMSDGSRPPARSAVHASAVVVLFPCVPATARTRLPRASSRHASSRFHTGMPAARAAATSGFASPYALDRTTTSAPATLLASNAVATVAPSAARACARGHEPRSEPLTVSPRAISRRATADMPMPPIPTMWNLVPFNLWRPVGFSSAAAELAELARDGGRGVGTARGARGFRHASETGGIVEQARDLRDQTIGIELAFAYDDRGAALGDVLRVRHLMCLRRGGERNEDEGHAERERLRDRRRARTSNDEVGRCECGSHLLAQEPVDLIALSQIGLQRLAFRGDLGEVSVAGVVDHDRAAQEPRQGAGGRVIDRGRTLAATRDEDHGNIRRYAELRAA